MIATSLQGRLDVIFFARNQSVFLDNARAGIPAKQSVVVPRRPMRLRFFKPDHRFAKTVVSVVPRSGRTLCELRLRATLGEDACVISPFVVALDPRQEL